MGYWVFVGMMATRYLQHYLRSIHRAKRFLGAEAMARETDGFPHPRSAYRWHRRLGSDLRFFPSYTVEGLGLSHLHLFLTRPHPAWLRFPYAVEGTWATKTFGDAVLYLHCLVPTEHVESVRRLVRDIRDISPYQHATTALSQSGWQALTVAGQPTFSIPLLTRVGHPSQGSASVIQSPLLVPVVFEGWNRQISHRELWRAINARLRDRLPSYLPRQHIYRVNGSIHVQRAYQALDVLFRQHLIRCRPLLEGTIELLLLTSVKPQHLDELLSVLQPVARMIEIYPAADGRALIRLAGDAQLIHLILHLPATLRDAGIQVFFVNSNDRAPDLRFAYEFLFNPKTGSWVFSPEEITAYMRGAL